MKNTEMERVNGQASFGSSVDDKVSMIHDCIVTIVERSGFQYQSLSNRLSQYMLVIGFILMLLIVAFLCLVYFSYDSREQIMHIYERLNELDGRI